MGMSTRTYYRGVLALPAIGSLLALGAMSAHAQTYGVRDYYPSDPYGNVYYQDHTYGTNYYNYDNDYGPNYYNYNNYDNYDGYHYNYPRSSGSLSITPYSGDPGTSVTVSGSAFPRRSSVTIYFDSVSVKTVTTDSDGKFRTTVRVPNLPEGLVPVIASSANDSNPPKFYIESHRGTNVHYYPQPQPVAYPTYPVVPVVYTPPPVPQAKISALQAEIVATQNRLANLIAQLDALVRQYGRNW